jgi:hypothetical protein
VPLACQVLVLRDARVGLILWIVDDCDRLELRLVERCVFEGKRAVGQDAKPAVEEVVDSASVN